MRIEILCLLHFCRPGFLTIHIPPWSSLDLQVLRICRSQRLDMGLKRVMWVRRYQGQCRALRPLGHQGYRLRNHKKDQPLCSGYTQVSSPFDNSMHCFIDWAKKSIKLEQQIGANRENRSWMWGLVHTFVPMSLKRTRLPTLIPCRCPRLYRHDNIQAKRHDCPCPMDPPSPRLRFRTACAQHVIRLAESCLWKSRPQNASWQPGFTEAM